VRIQLLNHAAVIIEIDDVRLLCDPWFAGTCFAGGWGLLYDNPAAVERCRDCTHLWISHFHGDHFHVPTLKTLLEINPNIAVLGNRSYNFQMDTALRSLGFSNVRSLPERKQLALTPAVSVTRFPTTGIDNMLLITAAGGRVLNYNDCNVPRKAERSLANQIGQLEVLLANFNHASKLLDFPERTPEETKRELRDGFVSKCESFSARWVVPFASYHYYRAPETAAQNTSLLSLDEIAAASARVIPLGIGQSATIAGDQTQIEGTVVRRAQELTRVARQQPVPMRDIQEAFRRFKRRVNISFGGLTWLLPVLRVYVSDLDRTATISFRRGFLDQGPGEQGSHVRVHSECLFRWFSTEYGTDAFWVGGHFELCSGQLVPLRWQLLVSLMTENRVDLWSLLKCCVVPEGWRFLWCRREEILSVLAARRFVVGSRE